MQGEVVQVPLQKGAGPLHLLPQLPQFKMSLFGLTHVPLQQVNPCVQAVVTTEPPPAPLEPPVPVEPPAPPDVPPSTLPPPVSPPHAAIASTSPIQVRVRMLISPLVRETGSTNRSAAGRATGRTCAAHWNGTSRAA